MLQLLFKLNENRRERDSLSPPSRTFLWRYGTGAALCIIALINLACFANSLSGYFHDDDFQHILFMHQALHGHLDWLVRNINSPWQDHGFKLFFRPLVEVSLGVDDFFFQGNALGYHATNLLLQIIASFSVFGLTKRLLQEADQIQAYLAALVCACLFSAFPLHPEMVAWPIDQVDGLCAVFYLLSLWLFVKHKQDRSAGALAASYCCFAASLLSKEMAATLPVTVGLYAFLFHDRTGEGLSGRLSGALKETVPYWLVLGGYLALRAAVLGSILGGYVGSLGVGFYESYWRRLVEAGSLWLLVYPINSELVPLHGRLSTALHILYMLTGVSVLLKHFLLPGPQWSRRLFIFVVAFLMVSPLPALQVLCITGSLCGSRFVYLATAPLCMLLGLLLFPFTACDTTALSRAGRALRSANLILVAAFVCCFGLITYKNNQAWLHASEAMIGLQKAIAAQVTGQPERKRIVILNLPRDVEGASMFYEFESLKDCLMPPFVQNDLSQAVGSLEPQYFNELDLINASRLREMLESGRYSFYFWNGRKLELKPASAVEAASWRAVRPVVQPTLRLIGHHLIEEKGRRKDRYIFSCDSQFQPSSINFVDVKAVAQPAKPSMPVALTGPTITISWATAFDNFFGRFSAPSWTLYQDGQVHTYRFPVGERKSWFLSRHTGPIYVDLPADRCAGKILSARLVGGQELIPSLSPDPATLEEQPDGLHAIHGNQALLHYDASYVPGAEHAVAEISPPYYNSEQYSCSFREDGPSRHALFKLSLPHAKGTVELPARIFPRAAWYQVRVAGVSGKGRFVGYMSDPVYIQWSSGQLALSRTSGN